MRQGWAWLGLLAFAFGCSGNPQPVRPSEVTASGATDVRQSDIIPPFSPTIAVGQEIQGRINNGGWTSYSLTPPSDGMLVLRLNWNEKDGTLSLVVGAADVELGQSEGTIIARLVVIGGQTYHLWIYDPWIWAYGVVPFVLAASMEH
jgi:hypothetical protein